MENNSLENLPPFYVGQKVIQTIDSPWINTQTKEITSGPKLHEICSVSELIFDEVWCIKLQGYKQDDWFEAASFKPLKESIFPSLTMTRVIEKERQLVSMN